MTSKKAVAPSSGRLKLFKMDFLKNCVVKFCVITSKFTQMLTVRQVSYVESFRSMTSSRVTWRGIKGALFELKYKCFDAKIISNSVEKVENVINETALHLCTMQSWLAFLSKAHTCTRAFCLSQKSYSA